MDTPSWSRSLAYYHMKIIQFSEIRTFTRVYISKLNPLKYFRPFVCLLTIDTLILLSAADRPLVQMTVIPTHTIIHIVDMHFVLLLIRIKIHKMSSIVNFWIEDSNQGNNAFAEFHKMDERWIAPFQANIESIVNLFWLKIQASIPLWEFLKIRDIETLWINMGETVRFNQPKNSYTSKNNSTRKN